jgi:dephospho-CoA kinase
MLVIGLTGGIASGKTTISNLFSELGVPIVDTDIVSRELLEKGQPGFLKIQQKLGNSYLLEDGDINRAKLRQAVFNDLELKAWLESMLHPLIYRSSQQKLELQAEAKYSILVVPLLFETNFDSLVDRILVVDCSRETQLKRLLTRDNIDESLATKMLNQQLSNDERLSKADDIIHNDLGNNLKAQVENLHQHYLTISV